MEDQNIEILIIPEAPKRGENFFDDSLDSWEKLEKNNAGIPINKIDKENVIIPPVETVEAILYPSWVKNENGEWVPPIDPPESEIINNSDGSKSVKTYVWNETITNWEVSYLEIPKKLSLPSTPDYYLEDGTPVWNTESIPTEILNLVGGENV